ncbi:hypothetical protein [Longimicrobium terrae]|uniref:Uncharacterized protein n=1 Tax=Longimicrobium terrae TaxID=1639882 RepID=A0A841H3C2_9BACT|nr:hypothetical protein [Longimicrobium terrae]MBB4638128.1 hypothetical protein [Longimicrobium terrae]MBB6072500.1 hypothetical protein [Longimicrobium terrae]NNC32090.1 hypothetical protein [Longimicrobium terrae]
MKKIVLNVDALTVDSFVAESERSPVRGTVQGHATLLPRCFRTEVNCTIGYNTCDEFSCVETCGYPYKPAC